MKVKTYKAMDMQEAMRQIKEDLGPEAVILSTRKVVEGKRLNNHDILYNID